jgi:hypothetical protein
MQVPHACFDTAMNAVLEPTIVVGKEVDFDAAKPDMPVDGLSLQGSIEFLFSQYSLKRFGDHIPVDQRT